MLPPLTMIFFLVIAATISFTSFNTFQKSITELIEVSAKNTIQQKDIARNIGNVQQAVSQYFSDKSEEGYLRAKHHIQLLLQSTSGNIPQETRNAAVRLDQLIDAVKIRMSHLEKVEQRLIQTRKDIFSVAVSISAQKVSQAVQITSQVGTDIRHPNALNNERINNLFDSIQANTPPALTLHYDDLWDIWAGYTTVYLKLRSDL